MHVQQSTATDRAGDDVPSWCCNVCTLINSIADPNCQACGAALATKGPRSSGGGSIAGSDNTPHDFGGLWGVQQKEKQRRQRRQRRPGQRRVDFAAMDKARFEQGFEATTAVETTAGGQGSNPNTDTDIDGDRMANNTIVAGDGTNGDGNVGDDGGFWDPTELALEFESLLAIFGPTRLRRLDADALYMPGLSESRRASIAEVWELGIEVVPASSNSTDDCGGSSGNNNNNKGRAAANVRIGLPVGYPARRAFVDVTQVVDSGKGAAARRAALHAAVDAAAAESASHAEVCVYELAELVKAYIAPVVTTAAIEEDGHGNNADDADNSAEEANKNFGSIRRTVKKSAGKARGPHRHHNHDHNRLTATGLVDAPGEILSTVFASLRFPDHLLAAATVCRHWRRAAEADRRWKKKLERFVANTVGYSAYTPRSVQEFCLFVPQP